MRSLACFLLTVSLTSTVLGAGWRNDGTGLYPSAKPPTEWSAEDNVVWKTKLPSWSNCSPAIHGDRIYVSAEPSTIMCLSKADGSVIWRVEHAYESFLSEKERAEAARLAPRIKELEQRKKKLRGDLRALRDIQDEAERKAKEAPLRKEFDETKRELGEAKKYAPPSRHGGMGYATPTPACDGKNLFVVFGNGTAACHDIDGKKKWARIIGKPTHGWGHSASPVLVGGKAIIQVTDVLAFDAETGNAVWKAPGKQVFGSIFHTRLGDRDVLVTAEGNVINAEDGEILATDLKKLTYNAPVVADGTAFFIQHGGKAFALQAGGQVKAVELWKTEPKKDRYYGSPLIHDGLIYAVTQKGVLSVIDATDGSLVNEQTLGTKGTHYTSPTLAGDYLFIGSESGQMAVLKPGRAPETIAVNKLEKFRCSPVFEGSRMYLRGFEYMYCIGE